MIIMYGDKRLRQISEPIEEINSRVKSIINILREVLKETNGVGIAASQIGVSSRLIIADGIVMINPEITSRAGECASQEACLSVPGIIETVTRDNNITVEYLNEDNNKISAQFNEARSAIVQHEIDHLDGILFIDRLPSVKKGMVKNKLKKTMRRIKRQKALNKENMRKWEEDTKSTQ